MTVSRAETEFAGRRGPLFRLALRTSLLTLLTLGIYRFWMKTRLRRWYWSAIRPGGVPLEYTGHPVEILSGFLIAVTFLAFYIGVFNLILGFLSYSFLSNGLWAYVASFIGLIPLYFFARFRARRFLLGRTRWRGLRFGVESAAWRYAGVALWHWALTILSGGLLYPRQVFMLEKFRTDRTWLGDARFVQGGRWMMLIQPAIPLYLCGLAVWGLVAWGVAGKGGDQTDAALGFGVMVLPVLAWAAIRFQVRAFQLMSGHKRLGQTIAFAAAPRPWRIIAIWIGGYLLVALALMLFLLLMAFVVGLLVAILGEESVTRISDLLEGAASWGAGMQLALGVFGYFGFFILHGVLRQVLVTMPVLRHYAQSVQMLNAEAVDDIRQRPRDSFADAEGFAEALDIGAAL